MSQDLLITGNGPMQLPAHLAGANFGVSTDLLSGMYTGGNRIGLKGSRFRLVVGGVEEGVIQEPYLDTIVLGAAPAISRVYYADSYKNGENQPPTCYSADGVVPNEDVKAKQSDKCMVCPMNAKGSKISEGQQYKACGYFRRVVVMLAGDTERRDVFKLDVKSGGLFGDGTANEKNLNDYIKMIATRGVDAGAVVTRISFDTESSVPKLLFKAVRFITEDEMSAVSDLVHSDEVVNLKTVTMSTLDVSGEEPTSGDPVQEDEAPTPPPVQRQAQRAPAPAAQRAPAPAPAPTPAPQRQATQRPAAQAPAPAPAASQRPATQRPAATTQRANAPAVDNHVAPPQRQAPQQRAAAPAPEPEVTEIGTDDELADLLASLE